ncbi:MAG: Pr6Pr family membrane protein [Oscillospiraceae bacterium]|nr:Pr6Pr family membrane protein [Oscillospiraceae bacterium]
MRIRCKPLSVLFKGAIALIGTACLLVQMGLLRGEFSLAPMRYFTLLSNLLCVIYSACAAVWLLRDPRRGGDEVFCPALKGIQLMGITVTGLIAHFLLAGNFTMGGPDALAIRGLHYVVPVLVLLDWLLFDRKGWMKPLSPLLWTVFPLAYFALALIAGAARLSDFGGSRYPYPFIDVDARGLPAVLLTAAVLLAFFIALGYGFYFADRALARAARRRDEKSA